MPKTKEKTIRESETEEIIMIDIDDDKDSTTQTGMHGVINPLEARHHAQRLNETLSNMKLHLDTRVVKDVVKDVIEEFKEAIKLVIPQMVDANVLTILWSINDPMCLALRPVTEHTECLLEEMMPEKEIPHGDITAGMVGRVQPLNYDQKDMIKELFNDLEVAHERMAHMCGRLSSLLKTLTPPQMMIVLQATIRPMIQLNTMAQFLDVPAEWKAKIDLPEDISERVKLTAILDPEAMELKQKHANSAT